MVFYAVLICCDREIYKIGAALNLAEARRIMRDDFLEDCSNYLEDEELKNVRKIIVDDSGENSSIDWGFEKLKAWSDLGDEPCDWKIIKIDEREVV